MHLLDLVDPVLRGPLIACTAMGSASALIGALVVFQRRSLMTEVLSHACYPGMVIGALVAELCLPHASSFLALSVILSCAAVGALVATVITSHLVRRHIAPADAALSFSLAASFSLGLFVVSATQLTFPSLWRGLQVLLIGQAATIDDQFMLASLMVAAGVVVFFIVMYRGVSTELFDPEFGKLHLLFSAPTRWLTAVILVATVVIGIRFMGVLLMSALCIFPGMSARLLVSKFPRLLFLSAIIGGACGCGGVLLSHYCAIVTEEGIGKPLWLPTGPLIVLLLASCFFMILLFSKEEGLCIRLWRRWSFRRRCRLENVIKLLWRECYFQRRSLIESKRLATLLPEAHMVRALAILQRRQWVKCCANGDLEVTPAGMLVGRKLVRLHRLWELYLVEYCKMPKERVHPSAEEMEHILTPDVERELAMLLRDPSFDPHDQPIPPADHDLLLTT